MYNHNQIMTMLIITIKKHWLKEYLQRRQARSQNWNIGLQIPLVLNIIQKKENPVR